MQPTSNKKVNVVSVKNKKVYQSKKLIAVSSMGLLLAVVLPLNAEALTQSTTITSTIGSTINVFTTSGTVTLNATPTGSGVQSTASDTITVSTNNSSGYTLSVAETNASSSLVSGGNSIAATSGTYASPTALTANKWGYRVDSLGSFGNGPTSAITNNAIGTLTYAAVPATASPQVLKTTATTATNNTTTVWYSLAVNTSVPSGTYTNSVTYTAVTN
jgi:hypothetical protein